MNPVSLTFRALAGATVVAAVACSSATTAPPEEALESSSQAIVSTNPGWNGWSSLSGGLITDPAAVAYDNNHVGVLATNYDLYFNWFQVLGGRGWQDLGNNGNPLNDPPVVVRVGNQIEVFVQDTTSGFLLHKTGTFNGGGLPTWSGWENLWLLETNSAGGLSPTGKLKNTGRCLVGTEPPQRLRRRHRLAALSPL